MLLKENGYLYDADYIMRVVEEGWPLYFHGDAEWRDYMLARAAIPGEWDEEDDDA